MSLSFNVTMLRKRLQLLTAREIENQRRLETYSRFAPLFDALDAYSSPADALRRLSVLEKESGKYEKNEKKETRQQQIAMNDNDETFLVFISKSTLKTKSVFLLNTQATSSKLNFLIYIFNSFQDQRLQKQDKPKNL